MLLSAFVCIDTDKTNNCACATFLGFLILSPKDVYDLIMLRIFGNNKDSQHMILLYIFYLSMGDIFNLSMVWWIKPVEESLWLTYNTIQ